MIIEKREKNSTSPVPRGAIFLSLFSFFLSFSLLKRRSVLHARILLSFPGFVRVNDSEKLIQSTCDATVPIAYSGRDLGTS